ncbi:MAG: hypothetical protein HQM08_27345 [Candidatus Riflebacteria bacterium]|nr:hypothetical protein [Candidatus Riflebacteria bacterium]
MPKKIFHPEAAKKAALQREIQRLEEIKASLGQQCEEFQKYLLEIDNETRRIHEDLKQIERTRKRVEDLNDYFIDEPQVIPMTKGAWGTLAEELIEAGENLEKWLSSCGGEAASE